MLRSDERRRIASDLHDSTSQLLVVLQLQLGSLKRTGSREMIPLIDECEKTIRLIREQIRALDLGPTPGN